MAEVVTYVLRNLEPLVTKEVSLLSGVQVEVQSIKDKLQLMQDFLSDADAVEESDSVLPAWVSQVRDVAYDMADVLDEFKLHLSQPHQPSNGFYASIRRVYFSFKNLKTRHWIASEIQGINSRIKNIFEYYEMYINQRGSSSTSQGHALFTGKADHLVGISKPKSQIIDWLLRDDSGCSVVSVLGMAGLGKTTLVKQVYEDAVVKKHFKLYAWLTVSQSFKIEELFRGLVRKLCSVINKPVPQAVDNMDRNQLEEFIGRLLQKSRYLIVLDDVWRVTAWKAIKIALPDNKHGSRIVLTTRHFEVASAPSILSDAEAEIYRLQPLLFEDSWGLFCKKTFKAKSCPDHLEEICQKIVRKCGGLPLAIVAISGVLAGKDVRNIDEWEMVCRSLVSQVEGHENLDHMKKVFSLSFNDLPHHLKYCFLYLSIFPEDHLIEHMRLIRLWIAEGLVAPQDRKTLEEVAEGYLKDLIKRSLIEIAESTSDGRSRTYRIHDLFHELIVLKSRDQSFVTVASDQDVNWPEKVRRLSIINKLQFVEQKKTDFRLRSLIMFGLVDSLHEFSIKKLFGGRGLRLLTVLDLQAAPLQKFPDEVAELFHLRYLSLRDTKVKELPNSIGKLQNLETLDLKHTDVSELPPKILKLKKLCHLLVYRYKIESYAYFHSKSGLKGSKRGLKALEKIGCLHYLQKLCFIEVNQNNSAIMREVAKLIQLRRLGILMLKREDGMALCSAIEKLTKLRALSVTSTGESEIIDLNGLTSPPKYLQRLYLTGKLERLPHWIPSLLSLKKLYLKWSQLADDPLEGLQDLPNLAHLEFLQVCTRETLRFKSGKFQSLKLLGLDKLDNLEEVVVEEGAMPCLEKLIIQRCRLLHKVPMGIEGLRQLKQVELFDMPDQLIETLRPDREEEYWKVKHIPKVYSTYWNREDGGWDVYSIESFREGVDSPWHSPIMRINGLHKDIVCK